MAEGLPRLSLPATLVLARGLLEALAGTGATGPAVAQVPAVLRLLDGAIGDAVDGEARLASIADTLVGLSSLDFAARCEIRGDGSVLDGVSAGVNMLGEELATFVEERGRIERDLEDRVSERTLELTRANLALHAEIAERRRVEDELTMAHKLEAVGRLASGVAHEINTPVQFVSDSVQFVQSAFTDLSDVVDQLRAVNHAVVEEAPAREAAAAALAAGQAAELDYLLEQAPLALGRALEGLAHVASIVRSMKVFAHPDAKDMSSVDLNKAIESTLVMARNEYKYVADIATDFGELPIVMCYPGEINQALLNIIVNAAHAIGDVVGASGGRGRIAITTRHDDEHVVVAISDTGGGIPEAIRSRIFDPFFTTKAVGRGTGQGLAVVRNVIEKHAGTLSVDSRVGLGSTFTFRLPISPSPERA